MRRATFTGQQFLAGKETVLAATAAAWSLRSLREGERVRIPVASILTAIATVTLLFAWVLLSSPAAQAQTFKILYSFTGGNDGGNPHGGLVLDAEGNLYGTTFGGGDAGCFNGTCGVVFELVSGSGGWSESTLHTFAGGSDGGNPEDGLIFDVAGNLYGTADVGGVSCGKTYGCGVAFELSPGLAGWTETVLHSFQAGPDGYYPIAGLAFDKAGNLFSTLPNGGSGGVGVVYELTHGTGGWKEKTLYSFNGNGTGIEPVAAPIVDAAGNLYGTTVVLRHRWRGVGVAARKLEGKDAVLVCVWWRSQTRSRIGVR
jgi:hypothetical protein